MDTETMIRELKNVEEKHKCDKVFTGQLDIVAMTHDVRNRLEKLKPYEDTGLTPDQIIEMDKMYTELAKEVMQLRKRGTAMLLKNIKCAKKKEGYLSFGTCPKCKRRVSNVEGGNYCQNCGQRLKWEE